MASPVAILFLLKNAPNCTSEHLYFQKFSGGMPPHPPRERRFRGRCGFATKRTTLEDFLDPPLSFFRITHCAAWRDTSDLRPPARAYGPCVSTAFDRRSVVQKTCCVATVHSRFGSVVSVKINCTPTIHCHDYCCALT